MKVKKVAWNKGLTKETDERIKSHKYYGGGWIKGKSRDNNTKKKISETLKRKYKNGEIKKSNSCFKIGGISPRRGIILSKEIKNKISNTLKSYPNEIKTKRAKYARSKAIIPKKDTSIEVKIQTFLKQLGIEFFTHQYMKIEHGYQCDILIPSMNLVIECDGDYWHKYPVGNDIDHIRTSELISSGFKVLRLWEYEIKAMNINDFKEKINGC